MRNSSKVAYRLPDGSRKFKTIIGTFGQWYHSDLALFANLTVCAYNVLMYFNVNMDERNDVVFGYKERRLFIEIMRGGGASHNQNSVDIALKQLRDKNIIFRMNRGIYHVNASIIWKGKTENRNESIALTESFIAAKPGPEDLYDRENLVLYLDGKVKKAYVTMEEKKKSPQDVLPLRA